MRGTSEFSSGVALVARKAMILGVLIDFVLIAFATMGADSPLGMPGGTAYVVKAAMPLLAYGLISFWAPAIPLENRQPAIEVGTSIGVIGGVLQIVHMALENFGQRVGENSIITLAFMFSGFLIWGFAGYRVIRKTGDIKAGVVASCWSAIVSVLMAVTFGLILMSASFPPPSYVATWSEFKESGWTNARAFGIANSLDAVLSHLVIGPIIGTIFGIFAIGIAKLQPTMTK
jgi:hypothetical protein